MALSTYSDLLAAVADYEHRTDLTAVIPDFVLLTEAMINYGDAGADIEALRVRQMETTTTGVTLTSDFLQMKRVTYAGSVRTPLTYVSPNDLDAMYPTVEAGDPHFYTIVGDTIVYRSTGTASSIEQTYYKKIPPLVTNSTNWLMTASPNTYLYGSLFQLSVYTKNPGQGQAFLGLYRNAIQGLMKAEKSERAGSYTVRTSSPAW